MNDPQTVDSISSKLARVEKSARENPGRAFRSLHHHLDKEWMREAFKRTRKNGAVGVDGQCAEAFAENLESNLQALVDALHDPNYKAPPVRRVHIPKGDGRTRPIGIPTFADKVLQRAVTMVLQALYEPLFDEHSYGFRPGRDAHDALGKLKSIVYGVEKMCDVWILEVDIRAFFDTIDHSHLRSFLDERVVDGVIRRMIHKWLHAGVLEEGVVTHPIKGTPQGGVLSPLLGNVYLHHVLDRWFRTEVQPRLRGQSELVRYADDFVLVFQDEQEAREVWDAMSKRFAKYGLELHPDKTRLLRFTPPREGEEQRSTRAGTERGERRTFDWLGFTLAWKRGPGGKWSIRPTTSKSRFARALKGLREWTRKHIHDPVERVIKGLSQKLRGHAQYFDVFGNRRKIRTLIHRTRHVLRGALSRRSQRGLVTWAAFVRLMARHPLWEPESTPTRTARQRPSSP